MLLKFAYWIHYVFGDEFGGGAAPPGSTQRLVFGEPDDDGEPMNVATTYNNDGHDLWLGYRRAGWQAHYRAKDARRLAWFILWDWWTVSTWFGLKRRIWYLSLHIIVESYKDIRKYNTDASTR